VVKIKLAKGVTTGNGATSVSKMTYRLVRGASVVEVEADSGGYDETGLCLLGRDDASAENLGVVNIKGILTLFI